MSRRDLTLPGGVKRSGAGAQSSNNPLMSPYLYEASQPRVAKASSSNVQRNIVAHPVSIQHTAQVHPQWVIVQPPTSTPAPLYHSQPVVTSTPSSTAYQRSPKSPFTPRSAPVVRHSRLYSGDNSPTKLSQLSAMPTFDEEEEDAFDELNTPRINPIPMASLREEGEELCASSKISSSNHASSLFGTTPRSSPSSSAASTTSLIHRTIPPPKIGVKRPKPSPAPSRIFIPPPDVDDPLKQYELETEFHTRKRMQEEERERLEKELHPHKKRYSSSKTSHSAPPTLSSYHPSASSSSQRIPPIPFNLPQTAATSSSTTSVSSVKTPPRRSPRLSLGATSGEDSYTSLTDMVHVMFSTRKPHSKGKQRYSGEEEEEYNLL